MIIYDKKDDKLTFRCVFFFSDRLKILADKRGGCPLNRRLSSYNTEGRIFSRYTFFRSYYTLPVAAKSRFSHFYIIYILFSS